MVDILKGLYPTTLQRHNTKDITHTKLCSKSPEIHKTFSRILKGKAAGPFGDITDVTRSMVTHVKHPNNKHTYANTIFQFSNLATTNKMTLSINKLFNASFLFGLHKDKTENLKLRPVVVGESWKRAFTSTIVRHNIKLFMKFLTPYNYAIGVKGGYNFIYHTISAEVDTYITC